MMYIYKIQSKIDNKIYIGVTKSLSSRKNSHFSTLKHNKHSNSFLQNHYNKYGNGDPKQIFSFELIETVKSVEESFGREKYWVAYFKSNNRLNGFNLTAGGLMNCWDKNHIQKRKQTVREKSKPVFVYTLEGTFISKYNSIIETSERLKLNRNAVSNALNRGIRYKNYLFFREPKSFTRYIPAKSHKIVYIQVFTSSGDLIDTIEGLTECSEKYNINVNSLNSRCRRQSVVEGVFFKKMYKKGRAMPKYL